MLIAGSQAQAGVVRFVALATVKTTVFVAKAAYRTGKFVGRHAY